MNTSTPNIFFRLADEQDIPLLLGYMKEFYIIEHLPYDASMLQRELKHLCSNQVLGRIWIIYSGEAPVGYMVVTFGFSLEFHGIDALVDEFFIHEQYRGMGFGKSALKYAEEELAKLGIKALHLEVDRNNNYAKELYYKAGFKDHDRYLLTKWIK